MLIFFIIIAPMVYRRFVVPVYLIAKEKCYSSAVRVSKNRFNRYHRPLNIYNYIAQAQNFFQVKFINCCLQFY